jgi:hypothetical protein
MHNCTPHSVMYNYTSHSVMYNCTPHSVMYNCTTHSVMYNCTPHIEATALQGPSVNLCFYKLRNAKSESRRHNPSTGAILLRTVCRDSNCCWAADGYFQWLSKNGRISRHGDILARSIGLWFIVIVGPFKVHRFMRILNNFKQRICGQTSFIPQDILFRGLGSVTDRVNQFVNLNSWNV